MVWRFAVRRAQEKTGDVWRRWHPVWHMSFYAVLGGPLAVELAGHSLDSAHGTLAASISGLFALWYWVTIVQHRCLTPCAALPRPSERRRESRSR